MARCVGICNNGKRCKIKLNWKEICHLHNFCGICYEPVVSKFKTECAHIFCKDCIYRWFIENFNCPCCRKDLFTEELKLEVVSFGIKNKLLAEVTDNYINISSLDEDELRSIEYTGIKPECFMTTTEWEFKKLVVLAHHPEIYVKLMDLPVKTSRNVIRTKPEKFDEIQNSDFWLFD